MSQSAQAAERMVIWFPAAYFVVVFGVVLAMFGRRMFDVPRADWPRDVGVVLAAIGTFGFGYLVILWRNARSADRRDERENSRDRQVAEVATMVADDAAESIREVLESDQDVRAQLAASYEELSKDLEAVHAMRVSGTLKGDPRFRLTDRWVHDSKTRTFRRVETSVYEKRAGKLGPDDDPDDGAAVPA